MFKRTGSIKRIVAYLVTYLIIMQLFLANAVQVTAAGKGEVQSDMIIVSLGDSYSSGEGLGDYGYSSSVEEKIMDANWLGHRSNNAWSGRLTLGSGDNKIKMSSSRYSADNPDGHWYFAASSGAETKHISKGVVCSDVEVVTEQELNEMGLSDQDKKGYHEKGYSISGTKGTSYIRPQLDIFDELNRQNKKADFVTLSIGGNDLGFVETAGSVVVRVEYLEYGFLYKKLKDALQKIDVGGEVRENIKKVYIDILEKSGDKAKLIVAGYPQLFNLSVYGGIGVSTGINYLNKLVGDVVSYNVKAKEVNLAVELFNQVLQEIVAEVEQQYDDRIFFVSVEEQFKNHGAYAMFDPFINSVTVKDKDDINDGFPICSKSMHPNDNGAQVYADAVQEMINSLGGESLVKKEDSSDDNGNISDGSDTNTDSSTDVDWKHMYIEKLDEFCTRHDDPSACLNDYNNDGIPELELYADCFGSSDTYETKVYSVIGGNVVECEDYEKIRGLMTSKFYNGEYIAITYVYPDGGAPEVIRIFKMEGDTFKLQDEYYYECHFGENQTTIEEAWKGTFYERTFDEYERFFEKGEEVDIYSELDRYGFTPDLQVGEMIPGDWGHMQMKVTGNTKEIEYMWDYGDIYSAIQLY